MRLKRGRGEGGEVIEPETEAKTISP